MKPKKLFGSVTLPQYPKREGLVSWARQVNKALYQIANMVYVSPPQKRPAKDRKPPFWVSLKKGTEVWNVTVEPGLIRYQNINAEDSDDGATHYLVPEINETAIDVSPAPTLPLDSELFVYVKVPTDVQGNPEGLTATVELTATAQTSTHHVPPADLVSGIAGEYYFLIAEIEYSDSTPPVPSVKKRFTGNLHIPNQLIQLENVGSPQDDDPEAPEPTDWGDVYAGYNKTADIHKLRRIYGEGDVTVSTIGDYILISHCTAPPPSE